MTALVDVWPLLVSLAHIALAIAVTADAVLRKRHVQAIIGWVGLAWLAPFVGPIVYACFGINRIRRTATAIGLEKAWASRWPPGLRQAADAFDQCDAWPRTLTTLERVGRRVTSRPLLAGNRVMPLDGGDVAFPEMLAAIDAGERTISLQTYIFDNDKVGVLFGDALLRAARRGVEVRVLIDDVGSSYTRPSMARQLRRSGIRAATFLPTRMPRLFRYANLRNHRKIMVVDGHTGFTGGMNLRAGHWLSHEPTHPVRCLHFQVRGPVVTDLQRIFAIDWAFTTGETLGGEAWFPAAQEDGGPVLARGIADGPDEDLGKMPAVLLGALGAAEHRVDIVTPYFLPDEVLLQTLQITAIRGVEVNLVLPAKSNVAVMDWAMRPQMRELLKQGCRIHLTGPPFDHTKLFIVDDCWSLVGSTNWDARSLRLNFEYNLECYDRSLAKALRAMVQQRIASATQLDEATLRQGVAARLRDGLARLLSPYL